ncbi:MAG: hypothetical protein ACI9FW_002012 [Flavobacterium sp.]|jgi:hypothetical protein
MINYKLTERGDFTKQDFNNIIKEAIISISNSIKQEKLEFEEIRYCYNKIYKFNNENFCGTCITIKIFNDVKVLGYIFCFMDNKKEFIDLSTYAKKNY